MKHLLLRLVKLTDFTGETIFCIYTILMFGNSLLQFLALLLEDETACVPSGHPQMLSALEERCCCSDGMELISRILDGFIESQRPRRSSPELSCRQRR